MHGISTRATRLLKHNIASLGLSGGWASKWVRGRQLTIVQSYCLNPDTHLYEQHIGTLLGLQHRVHCAYHCLNT